MRGRAADGISVRRLYGQSGDGLALFRVADKEHDALYIDAESAAEARARAVARWERIDAERAERAARIYRERNGDIEDWPELAAAMWEVLLHG
jgi:hypothetical protein